MGPPFANGRRNASRDGHCDLLATPATRASDREYNRSAENESQDRTSGNWNGESFEPEAAAGDRRRAAPTNPADSASITNPIVGAAASSNAVRTTSARGIGLSALLVSNRIR